MSCLAFVIAVVAADDDAVVIVIGVLAVIVVVFDALFVVLIQSMRSPAVSSFSAFGRCSNVF